MDRYTDDLAVQIKDWLDKQLYKDKSKARDEKRIGGGGRVSAYDRNKSKSISPDTKMRKRGEEFLKKIESLKQKIHLEGKQIQQHQTELSQERRMLLQSDKITPSQKEAQDRLRKHQERKREEDLRGPKIRNYNDLRSQLAGDLGSYGIPMGGNGIGSARMDDPEESKRQLSDENENLNIIPPRAKTAVGQISNMRRVMQDGGYIQKSNHTKVADEIII